MREKSYNNGLKKTVQDLGRACTGLRIKKQRHTCLDSCQVVYNRANFLEITADRC